MLPLLHAILVIACSGGKRGARTERTDVSVALLGIVDTSMGMVSFDVTVSRGSILAFPSVVPKVSFVTHQDPQVVRSHYCFHDKINLPCGRAGVPVGALNGGLAVMLGHNGPHESKGWGSLPLSPRLDKLVLPKR